MLNIRSFRTIINICLIFTVCKFPNFERIQLNDVDDVSVQGRGDVVRVLEARLAVEGGFQLAVVDVNHQTFGFDSVDGAERIWTVDGVNVASVSVRIGNAMETSQN